MDIVERLRALKTGGMLPVIAEAADEIERLCADRVGQDVVIEQKNAEIERLTAKVIEWEKVYAQCDQSRDEIIDKTGAEIERLKAANESRGGEMDTMREALAATQQWNERLNDEIERLRNSSENWKQEALRLADIIKNRDDEIEGLRLSVATRELIAPQIEAMQDEIERLRNRVEDLALANRQLALCLNAQGGAVTEIIVENKPDGHR